MSSFLVQSKLKLEEVSSGKVAVVGVGGAGERLVSAMKESLPACIGLVDGSELQNHTDGFPERIRHAEVVIVIAAMAGRSGGNAGPAVARQVRNQGAIVLGVPLMPLDFEPVSRHIAAFDALTRFTASCDTMFDIPSAEAEVTTLHDALASVRSHVTEFVQTVAALSDTSFDPGGVSLDELRELVATGNEVGLVSVSTSGSSASRRLAMRCSNLLARESRLSEAIVIIESGQPLTIAKIRDVQVELASHFAPGSEPGLKVRVNRSLSHRDVRLSALISKSSMSRPVQESALVLPALERSRMERSLALVN